MVRTRHGIAKRREVSWRRRFQLRASEAVKVFLLKQSMERKDDQKRRKRDVWTCFVSRDDDIGSTWSSGIVASNSIMPCSVSRDDDTGPTPSSGMEGSNSIMAPILDRNKE